MKIKFYSLFITGLCLVASSSYAASVSDEAGDLSGKKTTVMESRISFTNNNSKKVSKKYGNHLYKKRSLKQSLFFGKDKFRKCKAFAE
ncbi:hypothetical protein [Pontibacter ruber]|uniref:Uncharacterized protein n=1 Tax=Pontibacter ruber TaxID=1343895 RepID=A0ABW5D291_9BACT|nr:hypothetical protein [Pontibacter ruber]